MEHGSHLVTSILTCVYLEFGDKAYATPSTSFPSSSSTIFHFYINPLPPSFSPERGEPGREQRRAEKRRTEEKKSRPGSREEKKREEKVVVGAVQPHRSHHRYPTLIPQVSVACSRWSKSSLELEKNVTRSLFCKFSIHFLATFPPNSGRPKPVQYYFRESLVSLSKPRPRPIGIEARSAGKLLPKALARNQAATRCHLASTIPAIPGHLRPSHHVQQVSLTTGYKPRSSPTGSRHATHRNTTPKSRRYPPVPPPPLSSFSG